jgi:hypothetical protein
LRVGDHLLDRMGVSAAAGIVPTTPPRKA